MHLRRLFVAGLALALGFAAPLASQETAAPEAAEASPNVLVFMSDDVGFAMSSAFGGPVPTPNFDRLAREGQRYNRFHTTGICSPSRAALLTGRNHHRAGVGFLSDTPSDSDGYQGAIREDTATVAAVLQANGYSTAMFGKHHNVPPGQRGPAGPFDSWPTSLGFDYFYGFPFGDVDQFQPSLFRGISRVADAENTAGDLLDARLADEIIAWTRNQQASAPDRPFFIYLAPGSAHAPHQAPADWIARFRGQFDEGWDAARQSIWRRQLEQGIIPADARLTERPAEIPAWDSLPAEERAFHARTMEVAAAMLAYQDAQLGRVLGELERTGELENTLIITVLGDNGASGEAGPDGTLNELRTIVTHDERDAWRLANLDDQGGPNTYQNYAVGWAWAMNTPFRWVKQYASMLGGIRNGMIVSWPGHVANPGGVCGQFSHLVDVAPTVLEASHVAMPEVFEGIEQRSLDGQSLLASLSACNADQPRTQYFEIAGKVGLYHDGWFLSGENGRTSWAMLPPTGADPEVEWTLYDLGSDYSQSTDLSAQHPDRLGAMRTLFAAEAERNDVYPLDHRFGMARASNGQRTGRKHFEFFGAGVSLPANDEPLLLARSYTLVADYTLDSDAASGVLVALGSKFGGWSLYFDEGRPAFRWARSTDPQEIVSWIAEDAAVASGSLQMQFATMFPGAPAEVIISQGGVELGRVALPTNFFVPAGNGEMLDVGRDTGVTVLDYSTPHGTFEGDISRVVVDFD